MTDEVKITTPLHVYVPRKTVPDRRYLLNLNAYRNWQGHESNSIKKAFSLAMKDQLEGLKIETPVDIVFRLFKGSNRITDKSNFYSILSKFLFDSITEYGGWEDDNDNFIKTEIQMPTELDRENPRAEFIINSASKRG